jgi:hypothetical protein
MPKAVITLDEQQVTKLEQVIIREKRNRLSRRRCDNGEWK